MKAVSPSSSSRVVVDPMKRGRIAKGLVPL
jgi:hypothetical protein